MTDREKLARLSAPTAEARLESLRQMLSEEREGPEISEIYANNHIHTSYSFSPYSPTAAVWFARAAGLPAAGIMDHDTMRGAAEFRAAGKIAGVATTCGFEARISFGGTFLEKTKINNPDQTGVAYMTFHSIRERYFDDVDAFLAPKRERRNERSRAMTAEVARITGTQLDFDRDVMPISQYADGGTITERHILFALAGKLLPNGSEEERYALLGKMKAELIPQIYIPASAELTSLDEAVAFAKETDAILCYAYLGDVTQSPTGDKKSAKYEDSYLPELFSLLKSRGVAGVTFMPSRNTPEQLSRVMKLCEENGMWQISGEDINSLGQSFICKQLADEKFRHLTKATWALVEREKN